MNIDNFEGRSVALGGGKCGEPVRALVSAGSLATLSATSRALWVVPRSELLTLPGAARPCYAHSKRTFQGPSREPSRGQLLEVSQIFLGRLRASKSSTRLMWRFLWRTNLPKKISMHVE